jgi:hypothetical protein
MKRRRRFPDAARAPVVIVLACTHFAIYRQLAVSDESPGPGASIVLFFPIALLVAFFHGFLGMLLAEKAYEESSIPLSVVLLLTLLVGIATNAVCCVSVPSALR